MNKFIEKMKDILYDMSDYIIIFGIIIGIVFIISWRLDILFPKTIAIVEPEVTVESKSIESKLIKKPLVEPKVEDKAESEIENADEAETPVEPVAEPVIVKILIPDDPTVVDVGNVLLNLELIDSIQEFEDKVAELSYEKSFHAGEFEVEKDYSLEEVLNTIAE